MDRRTINIALYIIVALVQLYVPYNMIRGREDVLVSGTAYRFKTAPIDPNDPFRGKYIVLRFEANSLEVDDEKAFSYGEEVYVSIGNDEEGFAEIVDIDKVVPISEKDYVKAKLNYVSSNGQNEVGVEYPFDRFYMEESKAKIAEDEYRQALRDKEKMTFALVYIKDGEAVISDVFIDGMSVRELKERSED